MNITNLDTDLLITLIDIGEATTTDLAKALFQPKDDYELRKYDNKIRYRLERMRKKELLFKLETHYGINIDRVFLTPATLRLVDIKANVPMGVMLVVYPKGGEIMMRQVEVPLKTA